MIREPWVHAALAIVVVVVTYVCGSWWGGPVTAVPRVIDRDRRFADWLEHHTDQPESGLLKVAWDEAWRLAVWAGMRENATLGLQVMELKQSITHLEGRLNELQFEEEVEQGSVYWESTP